jgi:hypothetical protein
LAACDTARRIRNAPNADKSHNSGVENNPPLLNENQMQRKAIVNVTLFIFAPSYARANLLSKRQKTVPRHHRTV